MVMNSSTSGNGPDTVEPSFCSSCTWEFPEVAHTLELELRVIEWLNETMVQGMYSKVKGVEVGGLLLGRTEAGDRPRTVIEGFTPILCRHSSGYIHHFSDEESSVLKRHSARWAPGPGKKLYVVGFYRSHNRKGFTLDEQDLALANEFFLGPTQVFLLIKPFASETSIGASLYQRNAWDGPESPVRFPFSSSVLAAGVRTINSSLRSPMRPVLPSPISAGSVGEDTRPGSVEKKGLNPRARPSQSTGPEECPPHILAALLQIPSTGQNSRHPAPEREQFLPYVGVEPTLKGVAQRLTHGKRLVNACRIALDRLWQRIRKPAK